MNALRDAMVKAGVVGQEDIARMNRQQTIAKERKRKRLQKLRWEKALSKLPKQIAETIRTKRAEDPGCMSLKAVESLARMSTEVLAVAWARALLGLSVSDRSQDGAPD